ncbi:MAG: BamA/TamA family outer membrane protein [Proteobacteria bacterium]|nr:BamA/TamA family outer membrane protein [Pseudomonadota bacterium]MBU1736854.1 BamA/TamA family outer membrane protein [Pseudomonadota bacterium]
MPALRFKTGYPVQHRTWLRRYHRLASWLMLLVVMAGSPVAALCAEEKTTFEITGFVIEGNTLLPEEQLDDDADSAVFDVTLKEALEEFVGEEKTAADVEEARTMLEKLYHQKGYPTVIVSIPEQNVEEGVVRLKVVEGKIRRVRITGNRFFTMKNILSDLHTLQEGEIIYLPHLQRELVGLNSTPGLTVEPLLTPGKEFGTVDVELKVKDSNPLTGGLEINNRASKNTSSLRLNGMLGYNNLWQKNHSVSFQYQMSPEEPKEVAVLAGTYVLPSPVNDNHRLALLAIWSDSETAFGDGFQVVGKGNIYGLRYAVPLAAYKSFYHTLSLGLDYKDMDETSGFDGVENDQAPITYLPFTISYNSTLPGVSGSTRFNASLNTAFRGIVTDQQEFENKRFHARGNYAYLTAEIERKQKLPRAFSLRFLISGQIANQPLISSEQFSAGGMESVRGYRESFTAGDNGLLTSLELMGPDLAEEADLTSSDVVPYLFFDFASLRVKDPLPGQTENISIAGCGVGIRGMISERFDYRLDWAFALKDHDDVESGGNRVHFRAGIRF